MTSLGGRGAPSPHVPLFFHFAPRRALHSFPPVLVTSTADSPRYILGRRRQHPRCLQLELDRSTQHFQNEVLKCARQCTEPPCSWRSPGPVPWSTPQSRRSGRQFCHGRECPGVVAANVQHHSHRLPEVPERGQPFPRLFSQLVPALCPNCASPCSWILSSMYSTGVPST